MGVVGIELLDPSLPARLFRAVLVQHALMGGIDVAQLG